MLEVIQEVLEAEKKAEAIIAEARDAVAIAQTRFDADERRRLQAAKSTTDAHVRERVAQIRLEAEQRYEDRLTTARSAMESFLDSHEIEINDTVESVLTVVTQTAIE